MRMKRALVGLFGGLGLLVVFATSGCGDSGGGGNSAAALASCNSYCDAYIAKACPAPPLYTTVAECKMNECEDDTSGAPANCNAAIKTYYDCRQTQADLCADDGCDSQFGAIIGACS